MFSFALKNFFLFLILGDYFEKCMFAFGALGILFYFIFIQYAFINDIKKVPHAQTHPAHSPKNHKNAKNIEKKIKNFREKNFSKNF